MSTRALPKTAAEFEAFVEEHGKAEKFNADGTFAAGVKSYVEAQNAERADLVDQVKQLTQSTIVDMFRENKIEISDKDTTKLNGALLAGGKPQVTGTPASALNGKFANLGEFVNTIWNKRPAGVNAALDEKLAFLNEYSEKIPSDGGFLVPEEFRQQLLSLSLETAVVKPRATVIPMSSATLTFPTVDATSNASSVYGGIIVYRKGEGEEFVESQAKFGRVKLDPTKQTALAVINNEVIKDAGGALTAFLNQNLPQAMTWYEDLDYIKGTGAGEPLGALSAANPGLITVAKETGQTAATIVWENIVSMYARMLPASLGKAVWIVTQDAFKELATMALTVGTGGSAIWMNNGVEGPPMMILGRPVIMTEKAPAVLGGAGDISFVDLSFYLVGEREGMSMETSEHARFTRDQTVIRVLARNDGRPWLTSAVTPQNGGPTLSPFVQLAARA